jgi:hypothetical protein
MSLMRPGSVVMPGRIAISLACFTGKPKYFRALSEVAKPALSVGT